jgi:hypothetical protein
LNDRNVLFFRKSKERRDEWESQSFEQYAGKVVGVFEASKQQCRVVLGLSPYDFEDVVEIQPQPCSCCVLSASEPFNEETEIGFKMLANWLDHYGLPQYHVQVSGHVISLQLSLF